LQPLPELHAKLATRGIRTAPLKKWSTKMNAGRGKDTIRTGKCK
jgi:hypothetical protein